MTSEMSPYTSLLMVMTFASVHLYIGRLRFLDRGVHNPWISVSAGVGVGYVFAYLLPKLAEMQYSLGGEGQSDFIRQHFYLFVMLGFIVYYKLDWASNFDELPQQWRRAAGRLQTAGFVAYSMMIGYLATSFKRPELIPVLLVTILLSLHFLGLDHNMRHVDPESYDKRTRYWLTLGLVVGWAIGILTRVSDTAVALWTSILAGGMLILVIKEELPGDVKASYLPFALGTIGSSTAIIFVKSFPLSFE